LLGTCADGQQTYKEESEATIAHKVWANLVIIPCGGEGVCAGRAEQRKIRWGHRMRPTGAEARVDTERFTRR